LKLTVKKCAQILKLDAKKSGVTRPPPPIRAKGWRDLFHVSSTAKIYKLFYLPPQFMFPLAPSGVRKCVTDKDGMATSGWQFWRCEDDSDEEHFIEFASGASREFE